MPDLFAITNGLSIGIAFFLAAAGLTILFGILRVLNFAHGSFLMVGAYLASTTLKLFPNYGMIEFLFVAFCVGAIVGALGIVVDRVIFRRLHGLEEAVALIATFALMLVVDGTVELIWGSRYVSVDVPNGLEGALIVGPLVVPLFSLLLLTVGVITFLALDLFLHRSWTGKTLLAISDDRWIMSILGHSPRRLELVAMFLAFFLAGFAGAILVPNQILTPTLGSHLIIQAFAVVVVGGLGSVRGAFLAALLLGIAESFGSVFMPSLSLYIGLILILILRPQGLIPPKLAVKPPRWSLTWLWRGTTLRPALMPARSSLERTIVPEAVASAGHTPLHPAALLLAAAVLASISMWGGGGLIFTVSLVLIATVFSLSWNLMFGFGGIASFGHAAFFAMGAYLSASALKSAPEMSFAVILAGAFLLGGAAAAPIGIIALRRVTGVHLAILTLAVSEVLRVLISYSPRLGRDEGISAVPRPWIGFGDWSLQLASDRSYYSFLCIVCVLIVLAVWAVCHSRFGRILRSIRQDSQRAVFLGVNVDRVRLQAFVLAAAVAALAGALYAPLSQIVTPATASIARSTEPMLKTLLGGAGSFWGPPVGAVIFAAIDYGTRTLAGLSGFIMGITLLVVVLAAPQGAAGLVARIPGRFATATQRRPAGKPASGQQP